MKWLERALDILTVCLFVMFLTSLLDFSLLFKETMVAGGDMISHPAIVEALKEQWSRGQFWAWNQGWFGGYPNLYYYFYPVYILAAFLDMIGFSSVVAFKLAVGAVVLSVPTVTYIFARRWLSYPLALFLTSGMMVLFLNEMDSRSGGNLKSLLAGQISHELGLVWLTVVFGYLARRRFNGLGAAFALAMTVLCHVYTAIFAVALIAGVLFFEILGKRSFRVLMEFKAIVWALGMTAFFWVPFVVYRSFTVAPINHSMVTKEQIFNLLQLGHPIYLLFYGGLFFGMALILLLRRSTALLFVTFVIVVVSGLGMQHLNGTPILHIRLPAQIYLLSLLGMVLVLYLLKIRESLQWAVIAPMALVLFQSFVPSQTLDSIFPKRLRHPVVEASSWWSWNMSGIENKKNSDDVLSLWSFLRLTDTKDSRIVVEYGDYNSYGSPRIFEMTYAVTGKPILEGLLLESSVLYPSYFYSSFFLVPSTWWPGFPVQVPPPDVKKGLEYLSKFHVGYYVAATEGLKTKLRAQGHASLYKNDAFEVFRVNESSSLASLVSGNVPHILSARPLYESVLNYPKSLDVIATIESSPEGKGLGSLAELPSQELTPLQSHWSEDKQALHVEGIPASVGSAQPVLFKIPYFPNWKVDTGEEVQISTPNMMIVETERSELVLRYRPGIAEQVSGLVSFGSWVVFLFALMIFFKGHWGSLVGSTLRTSHSHR